MTKPFNEVLAEMQAMHDKKSQDYGVQADPFANVRASEDFGIPGWLGTIVRLNDKITRIKSFAKNGSLANESLRDSLIDIAVYGAIAVALYDQQETKPKVSFGSMVGKALAKYEDARIQRYYNDMVEKLKPPEENFSDYRCDGSCENCTCEEGNAPGQTTPALYNMTNQEAIEEGFMAGCKATYYHLGEDRPCELPDNHAGAHENWHTAAINGEAPLQWAGKPEPVRAT
jgi:hypothetical protein